jgi:hypothetical protein
VKPIETSDSQRPCGTDVVPVYSADHGAQESECQKNETPHYAATLLLPLFELAARRAHLRNAVPGERQPVQHSKVVWFVSDRK